MKTLLKTNNWTYNNVHKMSFHLNDSLLYYVCKVVSETLLSGFYGFCYRWDYWGYTFEQCSNLCHHLAQFVFYFH